MPVRTFDGVDDRITFALGALGVAFGAGSGTTVAMIVRSSSDSGSTRTMLKAGTSSVAARWDLAITSAGALDLRCGSAARTAPNIALAQADGWCLLVARKADGTVAPRFSRYKFSTAAWTHEDALTALANSGTPSTSVFMGAAGSSFGTPFPGDVGIAAVWQTYLSDAEVEALIVSEANWSTVTPVALWPPSELGDASTVQDTVGGADETAITGTTVTADDIPWTGGAITGTIAQTLPALTQDADGTHTAPTFTGTAAQTLPALTQAVAGTVSAPTFAGTVAQALPSLAQGAAGTTTPPTFTATAAQTLPSLTQAASGTAAPPVFSGQAAQTLPALTQAATGATLPPLGGSMAQTLPALTQTATGVFDAPAFSAVIAQTLPMLLQALTDRKPVASVTLGERGFVSVALTEGSAPSLSLSTRSTPTLEVT